MTEFPLSGGGARDCYPREELILRLTELWRQALSPLLHGAGCGCCSNVGVVLRPDWLEEDVQHYLRSRYITDQDAELRSVLASRVPGAPIGFIAWLGDLERGGVPPDDADRLRADVLALLSSITRPPSFAG